VQYELDRGRPVIPADQDGWVVGVEDERMLVRTLLSGTEVVRDRGAVVCAADPCVPGAELELGRLRACFTASRVAKRVAVSTPLRIAPLCSAVVMSVVVILVRLLECG